MLPLHQAFLQYFSDPAWGPFSQTFPQGYLRQEHPPLQRASVRASRERGCTKERFCIPSGPGRAFKGLGVAKRYCSIDSIGDRFVQYCLAGKK